MPDKSGTTMDLYLPATDESVASRRVYVGIDPGSDPSFSNTFIVSKDGDVHEFVPTEAQKKVEEAMEKLKTGKVLTRLIRQLPHPTTLEAAMAGYPRLLIFKDRSSTLLGPAVMKMLHEVMKPRLGPPTISIHRRNSGAIVTTVNLSRGGFTCFMRRQDPPAEGPGQPPHWCFGFAFRAPTDPPSSKGKDIAAERCGKHAAGTKHSGFAGEVYIGVLDRPAPLIVLQALRRIKPALFNVRWWTDVSMKEATRMLHEAKDAPAPKPMPVVMGMEDANDKETP